MHSVKYSVLALFLIQLVHADSAVQTDWSGGNGIPGPVCDWSNEFYQSSYINWSENPGSLLLSDSILKHIIDEDFEGAWSVYSEDIDGDGDMDVLGAAWGDDDITWWENSDTTPGIYWTEHLVDGDFVFATSVYSEDIDGDGDMDILGAAWGDDDITWWENADGSGTSWVEHTIDGNFWGARSVYSEDIDGDGDMDVLGAAVKDNYITWWENIDGSGTSWTEHTIDSFFWGAICAYSEDINGDGHMDVIGAAYYSNEITWWENLDGSGMSWAAHNIAGGFEAASYVYSEDIDGDGDKDILGTAYDGNDITWWENVNGLGTSWNEHNIDGDFEGAGSVHSEDMDADGDMDVLGSASTADDITWWENLNGSGTSWIEHTVDGEFNSARTVYSEDVNGDGDMDVLGAGLFAWEIAWWDLNGGSPCGELVSSILYLGNDPGWGDIDWSASTPTGTSVSFLVRASDNYGNMGVWSDTLEAPCSLEGILNEYNSYFQYKVLLETADPETTTPSLHDVTLSWNPLGIDETSEPIPAGVELLPIAPNPSAGSPVIRFGLPETVFVNIVIFDLAGRIVSEIHRDEYSPGFHDVMPGNLSPGIYFCMMSSEDFTATQRFVVIE